METHMLPAAGKFSYRVEFRYKKFNDDLRLTDFIRSSVLVTADERVPDPLERNWVSILEALNPTYQKTELIRVQVLHGLN